MDGCMHGAYFWRCIHLVEALIDSSTQ
jgi:hypothetical protein